MLGDEKYKGIAIRDKPMVSTILEDLISWKRVALAGIVAPLKQNILSRWAPTSYKWI